MCIAKSDCTSGLCYGGLCVSCSDGKQDGRETDVDCGGPDCGKCAVGKACTQASDCQTGICNSLACRSPLATVSFAAAVVTAFVGNGAIACGDLDGDGKGDIVSWVYHQNTPSVVEVALAMGGGQFGATRSYPYGYGDPGLGDVDGDGKLDVVTQTADYSTTIVLPGVGDGTLGAPVTSAGGLGSFGYARSMNLVDFNGDGRADVAYGVTQGLGVRLGNADDGFGAATNYGPISGIHQVVPIRDHGSFGVAFTAYTSWNGDTVESGLWGRFPPNTMLWPFVLSSFTGDLGFIIAGDVDGDGVSDYLLSYDDPTVRVYSSARSQVVSSPATAAWGTVAATGDFNLDGLADVVLGTAPTTVLLGRSDATFTPAVATLAGNVVFLAVCDVDGDGKPDVVALDESTTTLRAYLNTSH